MNELTELLERLRQAEIAYKTAKTSLDGSNALIIAKQELKEARYNWLKECFNRYKLEGIMKTGKTRYRVNWLGKVILQVEEFKNWDIMTDCKTFWRDATKEDL